ncbi:MAG: FecR family protein [Prevotella sp.]|jgi:ferric-dicitrate binding protein FerR (iron transport regulator)|nr:FecR family protein [Prevotella sp.]
MDERLTNYLLGLLSDKEKLALFEEMESNESLKAKYAEAQNIMSLAQMVEEHDDDKYTANKLNEFKRKTQNLLIRKIAFWVSKYAAAILILIGVGFIFNKYILDDRYIEYTSPVGKRTEITLSDGTTVHLAPSSKIRVPKKFEGKERLVKLDGEGLFDVTKNKEVPFIVETGKYNIQVLGTKFNVRAYSKDSYFETFLLEGSVNVYNDIEKVQLQPNEGVTLVDNRLIKTSVDITNVNYMQTGVYTFENKSLREILSKLETWYGIEFKVTNKKLENFSLSGKFIENDKIEHILLAIQQIYPFRYKKISENVIEIY